MVIKIKLGALISKPTGALPFLGFHSYIKQGMRQNSELPFVTSEGIYRRQPQFITACARHSRWMKNMNPS